MSQAGAAAQRRSKVEREFGKHAREIAQKVAAQFQPVYERVCRERDEARERAAVLQTVVEKVAVGAYTRLEWAEQDANAALQQLRIVPDIQTVGDGG